MTIDTNYSIDTAQITDDSIKALATIRHGVERETLRISETGALATTAHPKSLGSALKHEWITTDFSESLLEFITPPEVDVDKTIDQLVDIHKYVYENIQSELLWPLSMPCFVDAKTDIPIANYGRSNIGKLKEVYRKGLHNRYGSMMQVIAGVHLNMSFPDEFWQHYLGAKGVDANKQNISNSYFSLIRNFRRFSWLVPYLFGASPALCGSFIAHKKTPYDFRKLGKGSLYLPHSCSLRMSDLGYTSNLQSELFICYNNLSSYVKSVRSAINQPADLYANIPAGQDGVWEQLNSNILQIENELYAPIRPKQVANYLEKPTDALESRGVSYIEVRGLDVNPFSQVGIDAQQIRFMDAFLLYCLCLPSPEFDEKQDKINKENLKRVVIEGRKPDLRLVTKAGEVDFKTVASDIFNGIRSCAQMLDQANSCRDYTASLAIERAKVNDAALTFSGRMLNILTEDDIDNSQLGVELAKEYKSFIDKTHYRHFSQAELNEESAKSLVRQEEQEAADTKDFSTFAEDYFNA